MGDSLKVKDNLVSLIKFREHKENGQGNYLIFCMKRFRLLRKI